MKEAEKHYNLAKDLIKDGRTDEAIKELEEAIGIDPEYESAYKLLRKTLVSQERLEDLIKYLHEAVRIDPENIVAHFFLADAHEQKGQLDEAIKEFREVIRISPEFPYAYSGLGLSLNEKGMCEEAIEALETYLKMAPSQQAESVKMLKDRMKFLKLLIGNTIELDGSDKSSEQDVSNIESELNDITSEKISDKDLAVEIIAKALGVITSVGIVEAETGHYKGKTMSAEKVQELGLMKEALIQAFLKDPRVTSAEFKDGKFRIDTTEGKLSFKFKFEE